ncbi:hypothetical protein [Levilactobacillus tujiorum]|uniref:hypothetical protein n=1 Tax=Levilactobacillus tujiorum TaxID=2912243 RepID=UPI001456D49A|nr:hypothetical protein [Levilactobacillus tujiorum]NLR30953.1 hypothetical protein [Levilactobacillus tujiorum]
MAKDQDLYVQQVTLAAMDETMRLLCLTQARKSETMYLCLINRQRQYLTFRVSYHAAKSGFLSIPTFAMAKRHVFEDELNEYFPKASWLDFRYADFFVLAVVKHSRRHHIRIQIDDLYSIFSAEKEAMVFYQIRASFRNKRTAAGGFDEETNQVLRKLFATGLISNYQKDNQTPEVYISEIGMRLLDFYASDYLERFMADYQRLDWDNISMPQDKKDR